jgi:hypothetical protein
VHSSEVLDLFLDHYHRILVDHHPRVIELLLYSRYNFDEMMIRKTVVLVEVVDLLLEDYWQQMDLVQRLMKNDVLIVDPMMLYTMMMEHEQEL